MASKPKARGAASDKKPKAPKEATKPQRERFIETARAHGVDETGREFERALVKIMPPKRGP